MTRRLFKLMLTIVCLLSSLNISAYDFKVDGLYYDVVSLSERTCKLVSAPNKYDVVIPAHVSYGGETLTVVSIAVGSFTSYLKSISIPNTVTSIANNMFDGCNRLESVRIEDGETVLHLGYTDRGYYQTRLFLNCPIRNLYIGRNLSYQADIDTGYSPFADNSELQNVIIGDFVTTIGKNAFYHCWGLTSVDISNSVIYIDDDAFSGCTALTMVSIHDIAAWCNIGFSDRDSNPLYYAHNLYLDGEKVKELVIPNSVTSIGDFAFRGCSGLTSVVIPSSVTSIGDCAFQYCCGLTSVVIPNSVISIGDYAFYGCWSLADLTVGSSVTRIGGGFIGSCDALTNLYMLNPVPVSIKDDFFTNNQYMTLNVFVLEEAVSAYQSADGWKNFWHLQGFTPTGIDNVKSTNMNVAGSYYDLSGSKLDAPRRGVNIINGKKVIMK